MTTLPTVTAADLLARNPCADWPARILVLCAHYRRERWGALEILSVDAAIAEDRLWVCLHDALTARLAFARGEIGADELAAARGVGLIGPQKNLNPRRWASWAEAWPSAEAVQAHLVSSRSMSLVHTSVKSCLRSTTMGKPITERRAA